MRYLAAAEDHRENIAADARLLLFRMRADDAICPMAQRLADVSRRLQD